MRIVLRSSSHQCSKILRDMPFWSMPGPAMTTQGFVVAVRSKILLEKWGNSNGFAVAPLVRSFMKLMLRW